MSAEQKTVRLPDSAWLGAGCKRLAKWPLRKLRAGWRRGRVAGARSMAAMGLFPGLGTSRLKRVIAWERIGLRADDFTGLADHVARTKFDAIGYWISREDLDWYRREDPFGSHREAVALAEEILSGAVPLAGCGTVQLGTRIPWTHDPVTGKPLWTARGALRPRRDIDTRFWVELNLHRHFAPVARAGLITGAEKFAAYIGNQWTDWLRSNPPIDEEYVSDGLELSLRVLNWTHVLFLLGAAPFGRQRVLRLLSLVARYGDMIEQQCDGNSNRNNHLAAEAFGLYFIGTLYPELEAAPRWRDKGLQVLAEVAEEQFSDDGVHVEQALGYQFFVAELLVAALRLAQRVGHRVPDRIPQRLDACTQYLSALARKDGSMARYGDEGMVLFSPTGAFDVDARRILTVLRALVWNQHPEQDAQWSEEAFWFAGQGQGMSDLAPEARDEIRTRVFDRGHAVLQTNDAHVHFDCSRHGLGKRAGHGHDDALSFDYHHAGQTWIGDIGTYTYLRRGLYRAYFAGAQGHSGVLFNGRGAGVMVPNGSFGWLQKADAMVLGHGRIDGCAWAAGRHLGADEHSLQWFPVVDRYLVLTPNGALLVVDWCEVEHVGELDNLLHFGPDTALTCEPHRVLAQRSNAFLQILSCSSTSQAVTVHSGADAETPGWYSPRYGSVVPAPVLRFRSKSQGVFWRVMALLPGTEATSLQVEKRGGASLVCSIVSPRHPGSWVIDRDAVDVKPDRAG